MSKKNRGDFFWVSYADLMTTLFFVMLVLFVLTVVYLKTEQSRIVAKVESLEKIVRLEEQFKPLEEDGDFIYLTECKKFVAKSLLGKEIFKPNDAEIRGDYEEATIEVGVKIEQFLDTLQRKNKDFSYLLVIEGNMANTFDMRFSKDAEYGYKKSYERALAVYNLWLKNNITFRKSNVEVIIAGSGFNGLCRDKREDNNKRFSIQIIPKVSNKL